MLEFLRGKFSSSEAQIQKPNLEYLHTLAAYKEYDVFVLEPGQNAEKPFEKPTVVYSKDTQTYTAVIPLSDGTLETRSAQSPEEAIQLIDVIIEESKRLAA